MVFCLFASLVGWSVGFVCFIYLVVIFCNWVLLSLLLRRGMLLPSLVFFFFFWFDIGSLCLFVYSFVCFYLAGDGRSARCGCVVMGCLEKHVICVNNKKEKHGRMRNPEAGIGTAVGLATL